jgi:hypothetical protein
MADLVHWPALEESRERAIGVDTPVISSMQKSG